MRGHSMDEVNGCAVTDCERCPALVESRSRIVNGTGPTDAALMIVGEAPGAAEDREGSPFVGRSGQLLTESLETHGFDRSTVRITNCVRCRPPENRNPRRAELEACRDHLHREIETVDPALLMAVGKVPSSQLLDRSVRVTAEAGAVHSRTIAGADREILVSLHPAAILYDRSQSSVFEDTVATAAAIVDPESDPGPEEQAQLSTFADREER